MHRYAQIKDRVVSAAKENGAQLVAAIGSSARKAADEYSDLDLIVVANNTDSWLYGEIPNSFGEMKVSFTEPTIANGTERRMLFDGYLDVDLIVLTPTQFDIALEDGVLSWVMNRGFYVLYDSADYTARLECGIDSAIIAPQMTENEFGNTLNDFYFHCVWSMKKLLRGEIWSAKMCIDGYLKNIFLRIAALYISKKKGIDTWHDGRFFDRWADEDMHRAISCCFAHYERADIYRALCETKALFTRVSKRAAQILGYEYPNEAEAYAERFLRDNKVE